MNTYVAPHLGLSWLVNSGLIKHPAETSFLVVVSVWIFAVVLFLFTKVVFNSQMDQKSVVPYYDPPENISPILGLFLMRRGYNIDYSIADLGSLDLQELIFIQMYERGLLNKLVFDDVGGHLEYEINEEVETAYVEEKVFLALLKDRVGVRKILTRETEENQIPGYKEINIFWRQFSERELLKIAYSEGYFYKNKIFFNIINFIYSSIIGGIAMAFIFWFIPVAGPWLSLIPLIPGIIYAYIIDQLVGVIKINIDFDVRLVLVVGLMSWWGWLLLLSKTKFFIKNNLTKKGQDVIRDLLGYKSYIQTVDRDRLTFSYSYDQDVKLTHTTLSWLVVFKLDKKEHWYEWYRLHKVTAV